jgi:hypothetical protein
MSNIKQIPLTYEEAAQKINYNPENGVFTWLVDVARNVKAGSIAGSLKNTRTSNTSGKKANYIYIRLNHYEIPAARMAWLLYYKEWPASNVIFQDKDTTNLRIENLSLGKFPYEKIVKGERVQRKMSTEAMRHYGLKRYYGIDLAKYQEMLLAQNGVCAICFKPETSVVNGKIKPLAVDHCHDSERIRGLLCARCNQAIGLLNEDINILNNAIEYLRNYNIADTNT